MKKRKFIFAFFLMSAIVFLSFNIKIRANSVMPVNVENFGFYYIKNKTTGLYLQDSSINNLVNDANAIQSNYNDGDKQIFKFMNLNNNVYEIYSELNTNKCLCVQSTFNVNNAGIGFEDAGMTHPINHRFKFVDTGDGDDSYYILTATSQFNRYVTASSSGVGAYLVQRNYSSSEHNKWYLEGINLNDKVVMSLNVGETRTFKYLVPDNLMYAVETSKFANYNINTILQITNLTYYAVSEPNYDTIDFSLIEFCNKGGIVISIKIFLHSTSNLGPFYFQVRKQQAVLYGFEYDGINTLPDLDTPFNELSNYYQTYKFENQITSHFLSEDERHLQRCNSEIVFFTGHGGKNNNYVVFSVDEYGLPDNEFLYEDDIPSIKNAKITIFSSCYSSRIINGSSMIDKAVEQGSQSAFGFSKKVSPSSARLFTNRLFEYLCNGETISQAASHASNHILFLFDSVKDYKVAGASYTRIVNASNVFSTNCIEIMYDINETKVDNNFIKYPNKDGSTRCYYNINGIISNYFIDITEKNGVKTILRTNINNIEDIEDIVVLPIKVDYRRDSNLIYYINNGLAIPVSCEEVDANGILEMKCTNLYDGALIKYEEFAYWEG